MSTLARLDSTVSHDSLLGWPKDAERRACGGAVSKFRTPALHERFSISRYQYLLMGPVAHASNRHAAPDGIDVLHPVPRILNRPLIC